MSLLNDYTSEILAVLRAEGLDVKNLKVDGKFQRCPTVGKPDKRNGAYSVHLSPVLVVNYINWEKGELKTWRPNDQRKLSQKEQEKYAALLSKVKKTAAKMEAKRHKSAAIRAQNVYSAATKCKTHPYLKSKGVSVIAGLRVTRRGTLLVPLKDIEGGITTYQAINDDGQKRYLLGGKKMGSFFSMGKIRRSKILLLCEGLATGLSLYKACAIPTVVAFDTSNLLPVVKALRSRYPDKKIILCADNDLRDDGSTNVGIEKASAAALAVNGLVAIPELKNGGKCDFNDLHTEEGEKAVKECVENAIRPFNMPDFPPLPHGFSFKAAGNKLDLYHENIRLGRALYNMAQARTKENKGWGRLVGCHDSDNNFHAEYISAGDLQAGNASWVRTLADMGWTGATEANPRKLLEQYLLYEASRRVLLVARTGWHDGMYVFPDKVIGDTQGEQPMLFPAPAQNYFETRGTLEGWQQTIGAWAVGNSRMTMAICAALAGFLLWHYDWAESFGIHLFGTSSRGKSTSLQAAASCCGRGSLTGGYIRSWLMTENALEALAAASSDAPLFLDEMAKVDPHVAAKAAYTLAGGRGKDRLEQDASLKQTRQWRCLVLSSGEKTFAGKLAEAGISPQAGQMVRFLDIPGNAGRKGVFENIHEHKSNKAFAKAIKQTAIKHYGHIAPAFISRLADEGYDKIVCLLQKYQAKNIGKLCDEDADGQVDRVADHFLICAFAGKLATEWGLLPWEKGEAFRAIKKCFEAWLTTRGGTKAMEEEYIINRVRLFIERHGDSRFQTVEGKTPTIRDRVGFKVAVKGQTRYLFLPGSFQKEICKGWDATQVAKVLHLHKMLLRDKDGYQRYSSRPLPELGRVRCYTVILPDNGK